MGEENEVEESTPEMSKDSIQLQRGTNIAMSMVSCEGRDYETEGAASLSPITDEHFPKTGKSVAEG